MTDLSLVNIPMVNCGDVVPRQASVKSAEQASLDESVELDSTKASLGKRELVPGFPGRFESIQNTFDRPVLP